MTLAQLKDEMLLLPQRERAQLAEILLESLGEVMSAQTERAWIEEAKRRSAEIRSGSVEPIPAWKVLQEIRDELG